MGDKVKAGQILGDGTTYCNMLHFELYNGKYIGDYNNALNWFPPNNIKLTQANECEKKNYLKPAGLINPTSFLKTMTI